MKGQLTLALKMMGMDIKENKNSKLLFSVQANWKDEKFAFLETDNINNLMDTDHFKATVIYCKANKLKYIIFAKNAKDIVIKENYKILPFDKSSFLLKGYLKKLNGI